MDVRGAFDKYNVNSSDIEAVLTVFSSDSEGLESLSYVSDSILYDTLSLLEECDKTEAIGTDRAFVLKHLGKEKDAKEKEDLNKLENASMSVISSNADTGFAIYKEKDDIKFLIEGKNLQKDTIESSLKAWLDDAKVSSFESGTKKYKYEGYAKCIKFPGENSRKTDKNESINWASAIISSELKNDYRLGVMSHNVDNNQIRHKIKQLSECYQRLEKLSENTKNISLSKGNAYSEEKDIVVKSKALLTGGLGSSNNTNLSIALSHTHKVALVNYLLQLVNDEIAKLTEALSGGMKSVTISCFAENIFEYNAITSIIKNALAKQGYEVSWREKNEPAIEILSKDIPAFFCLPDKDFPGFERVINEKLAVNTLDESGGLTLGSIYWNGSITNKHFTIQTEKLNRHVSVFGMTGSGKSNTIFSLLEQSEVPFMIIEPVKGEYRTLKKTYEDLVVYHTDADKESVLQINPFWFPPGGSLSFHMDAIKKIISSAFSLYAAMPNILEQCIYNCYVKKGWNVVKNTNAFYEAVPEEFLYPTFSDLCDEIELYLEKSDFTGETLSTYKGALLSRLKSFTTGSKGVLLNSVTHPDLEKWQKGKYVIELDGLADDADKSIVMGSLIMQYFQCVKKSKKFTTELKHLIVVEEAHRLFKKSSSGNTNQEVAAPEAQLVETLSNMMAEIRAYGEGFIIVDQSPNKVAEDVVSNSSTKIVHRLDNKKDIEMIENSLLMKDMSSIISGLTRGDAIIRTEGMQKPIKLRINKSLIKDSDYRYEPAADTAGLDNVSNVDFIMNNDEFSTSFVKLSRKFINQLLFDDLRSAEMFFSVYLSKLSKLLYLGGFSEISENADKRFFLLLTSEGVKKALSKSYTKQGVFALQMRMFADRICEILADGNITVKEISAFSEFRSVVLHEQIANKNKNGGLQEQGIAIVCGFHTVYTDILSELMLLINDKELDIENPDKLTVKFFEEILEDVWEELFVTKPEKFIRDNIILLLRSLYIAVSKNN